MVFNSDAISEQSLPCSKLKQSKSLFNYLEDKWYHVSRKLLTYSKTYTLFASVCPTIVIVYLAMVPYLYDQVYIDAEGRCEHHNKTENFFPWLSHAIIYSPSNKAIWVATLFYEFFMLMPIFYQENLVIRHMFDALEPAARDSLLRVMPNFEQRMTLNKFVVFVGYLFGVLGGYISAKSAFEAHAILVICYFVCTFMYASFMRQIYKQFKLVKNVNVFGIHVNLYEVRSALAGVTMIAGAASVAFFFAFITLCTHYIYSVVGVCELVTGVALMSFYGSAALLVNDMPKQITSKFSSPNDKDKNNNKNE